MSYLRQKWKKILGITDFVSEIKRVENYPDFEKLAHLIQQLKYRMWVNGGNNVLVIFCRSGSVV